MKEFVKKIQYAILLALIVVMPSCSDALDIDPEDALTQSEIYNDYKDMFTIKLGLYDIMQDLVEQSFVLGECRGDLVTTGPGAKGQFADVAEFLDNNVSENNKYIDWSGYYHLINQCNDALVKYPILKLKQPKLESDENLSAIYKHIVGETLWLRAWAYFKLIQNWGDVPFYTEPIYTVEQSELAKYNTPVSQDSILNQLERDLSYSFRNCEYNWAWSNLPTLWNHETVNMCAVVSLYTDVLMYRQKYQKAWDIASKIVIGGYVSSFNESFHSSFDISKNTNLIWPSGNENNWFKALFRYGNESLGGEGAYREEGLVLAFSIEGSSFTTERHPLTAWTNNRYSENGVYVVKPSYPSIQMFLKQDDQVRGNYGSYLLDDTYKAGTVDTLIWKYVGLQCRKSTESAEDSSSTSSKKIVVSTITRRGSNRSLGYGNINVCRTAGLWLRAAEAANRVGLSTTAVTLMNEVRNRVGVGSSNVKQNASVAEIENALIEERALELAYEGERWYDLVSVAVRRKDPNFLIDKVVAKAPQANQAALKARLQFQLNEASDASNNPMYWWKLPRPAVYRNQK